MTIKEPEEQEVSPESFFKSLQNHDRHALIGLIKSMYKENLKNLEEIDMLEDECRDLKENISNMPSSSTVPCKTCDMTRSELEKLKSKQKVSQSQDNSTVFQHDLAQVKTDVTKILNVLIEQGGDNSEEEDAKLKHGIGYIKG